MSKIGKDVLTTSQRRLKRIAKELSGGKYSRLRKLTHSEIKQLASRPGRRAKTPSLSYFDNSQWIGRGETSFDEISITVFKNKKIVEGGIDSHLTKKYKSFDLVKKMRELLKSYNADEVYAHDRRYGQLVARLVRKE